MMSCHKQTNKLDQKNSRKNNLLIQIAAKEKLKMDSRKTANVIISCVKASNLDYQIQESPFSLLINLRKTCIKDKNGDDLHPSSDFIEGDTVRLRLQVKVDTLEEENSSIRSHLDHLEVQLHDANEALQDVSIKLEKYKPEVADVLFEKNRLFKENQKPKQKVQEKEIENKMHCEIS